MIDNNEKSDKILEDIMTKERKHFETGNIASEKTVKRHYEETSNSEARHYD